MVGHFGGQKHGARQGVPVGAVPRRPRADAWRIYGAGRYPGLQLRRQRGGCVPCVSSACVTRPVTGLHGRDPVRGPRVHQHGCQPPRRWHRGIPGEAVRSHAVKQLDVHAAARDRVRPSRRRAQGRRKDHVVGRFAAARAARLWRGKDRAARKLRPSRRIPAVLRCRGQLGQSCRDHAIRDHHDGPHCAQDHAGPRRGRDHGRRELRSAAASHTTTLALSATMRGTVSASRQADAVPSRHRLLLVQC